MSGARTELILDATHLDETERSDLAALCRAHDTDPLHTYAVEYLPAGPALRFHRYRENAEGRVYLTCPEDHRHSLETGCTPAVEQVERPVAQLGQRTMLPGWWKPTPATAQ